jgi:hypothetical protein
LNVLAAISDFFINVILYDYGRELFR